MVATFTKSLIWLLRLLQFCFAVIILGVAGHMIHTFHKFDGSPREVVVPLIFSVLAIIFTLYSFVSVFILNYTLQALAAFLDFCLWVGYLASAGLLRHNYHVRGSRNRLFQKLYYGRQSIGLRPHRARSSALVRLLAALVVIQLILFFFSMLLHMWATKRFRDEERVSGTATRHKRFSRSTAASDVPPMEDPYNPPIHPIYQRV